MCRARKISVSSARLRCRPAVRNRGQPAPWTRIVDSTPSTTTPLSMIIETAPAPLVVYQRRASVTGYEPPETATPELDDELTDPPAGCRLLDDDQLAVGAPSGDAGGAAA